MRNAEKRHVKSNGAHAAILRDCAHVPHYGTLDYSLLRKTGSGGGGGLFAATARLCRIAPVLNSERNTNFHIYTP